MTFLAILCLILAASLVSTLLVVRAQHRGNVWLRAYAKAHGHTGMITALDSCDEAAGRSMVQRLCDAEKHEHAPLDDLAFGRPDPKDTYAVIRRGGQVTAAGARMPRSTSTIPGSPGRTVEPEKGVSTPPPPSTSVRDLQRRLGTPGDAQQAWDAMSPEMQAALRRHIQQPPLRD